MYGRMRSIASMLTQNEMKGLQVTTGLVSNELFVPLSERVQGVLVLNVPLAERAARQAQYTDYRRFSPVCPRLNQAPF